MSCPGSVSHLVWPDLIIPYSSCRLFFILRVLAEAFLRLSSLERLCERCRTCTQVRRPKSRAWLDEYFMNRGNRKVNQDATVSIDLVYYDVPMQFITSKVEVRFLSRDMTEMTQRLDYLKDARGTGVFTARLKKAANQAYPLRRYRQGQ